MAKDKERRIHQAVRVGQTAYGPGSEDQLLEVLPNEDAKRLVEQGALTGDWSGAKGSRGEPIQRRFTGQAAVINDGFRMLADRLGGTGDAPGGRQAGQGQGGGQIAREGANTATEPARSGEVRAPFDPETVSLGDLPGELASVEDPAVLGALEAIDTRKGATPIYNQRRAELQGTDRE